MNHCVFIIIWLAEYMVMFYDIRNLINITARKFNDGIIPNFIPHTRLKSCFKFSTF